MGCNFEFIKNPLTACALGVILALFITPLAEGLIYGTPEIKEINFSVSGATEAKTIDVQATVNLNHNGYFSVENNGIIYQKKESRGTHNVTLSIPVKEEKPQELKISLVNNENLVTEKTYQVPILGPGGERENSFTSYFYFQNVLTKFLIMLLLISLRLLQFLFICSDRSKR